MGITCVYAPNIPTDRRHLWHILVDELPKDCEWILGGDFNMTERPGDKSHDCGREISSLELFTWKELLHFLQVSDNFIHQGGPNFSWDNGQKGINRRLARLDRIYTPVQSKLNIFQANYFIHGYSVGSDHSPVHLVLHIGSGERRKAAFKWTVFYLQGDIMDKLEVRWEAIPKDATFFFKLRNVARFCRQACKKKTMESKKLELDILVKLEIATANLHDDINNFEKQGEVSRLKKIIGRVESGKANGTAIRARVKWQQVGDKCSKEFFRSVRLKNTQAVISELKE